MKDFCKVWERIERQIKFIMIENTPKAAKAFSRTEKHNLWFESAISSREFNGENRFPTQQRDKEGKSPRRRLLTFIVRYQIVKFYVYARAIHLEPRDE